MDKKHNILKLLPFIFLLLLSACTTSTQIKPEEHSKVAPNSTEKFLNSGTISLVFEAKKLYASEATFKNFDNISAKHATDYAPAVGFFTPLASFSPADNQVWLELHRSEATLRVYKGQKVLRTLSVEGEVTLPSGQYPLQHKQKDPLWYAPDSYFEARRLRVPPRGDHFRYRKGALGSYALYPTMDFVIHTGPFANDEIGGLKVNETDMASIFLLVPVGAPVIVK